MLSLPMKCSSRTSSPSHQSFQASGVPCCCAAHSMVEEMYPMGASNQTYMTLPAASGSSRGSFTPQSRSRVMFRGRSPRMVPSSSLSFSQASTWARTLGFHFGRRGSSQASSLGWSLSRWRYQ
jgi:hypothetical protein